MVPSVSFSFPLWAWAVKSNGSRKTRHLTNQALTRHLTKSRSRFYSPRLCRQLGRWREIPLCSNETSDDKTFHSCGLRIKRTKKKNKRSKIHALSCLVVRKSGWSPHFKTNAESAWNGRWTDTCTQSEVLSDNRNIHEQSTDQQRTMEGQWKRKNDLLSVKSWQVAQSQ